MKDQNSIPTALKIVAGLFLFYGISNFIGIVIKLVSGSLHDRRAGVALSERHV